jgi:hypothetical protein
VPKNPLNQLEAAIFPPTGRDFYLFGGLGKNSQLQGEHKDLWGDWAERREKGDNLPG